MDDLSISVRLTQFILNLKKTNFDNFKGFIIDFYRDFNNENKNYWEYEEWAKNLLSINNNSYINFSLGDNEFDKEIIKKYALLLTEIFDNELFATLFCHISNERCKHEFLLFIDYLIENYNNKSKILNCLRKMSEFGIYEFTYKKDFNFDGIYDIIECINLRKVVFSDGNKQWLSRTDFSYPVLISGANYIIEYEQQSNIYSFKKMKLKNLTFDLSTLPTKKMLSCNDFGIDYKTSGDKTLATDLVCELNNCSESLKKVFGLYEALNQSLEKEEDDIVKTKLSDLLEMQKTLEQLKLFLISEYDRNNIIDTSELKDSINRKIEFKKKSL